MPPKKNPALPLPSYLPDPDTCSDVVNMPVIVERMLVEIKTALGHTFAVKPAAVTRAPNDTLLLCARAGTNSLTR